MKNDAMRAFVEGDPSGDGPIRFVAGTEGMKIDGRDYRMAGMDLARFEANPVVLWCHNRVMPPIARGDAGVEGDKLMIDVTFDRGDAFAAEVERKYRDGFLNAVSMTAIPTDGAGNYARVGRGVVEHSELIEVSAVPVPLDADALAVGARSMRLLGRELIDLSAATLAEYRRELSANDKRERLRTLLVEAYGGEDTWVWVRDFGDDWVVYEVETDGDIANYRIGYQVDDSDNLTLTGEPEEVEVRTQYEPVNAPASTGGEEGDGGDTGEEDETERQLASRLEAMGFMRSTPAGTETDLDALRKISAALTPSGGDAS